MSRSYMIKVLFIVLLAYAPIELCAQGINVLQNLAKQVESGEISQEEAMAKAKKEGVTTEEIQLMKDEVTNKEEINEIGDDVAPTEELEEADELPAKKSEKIENKYFGYELFDGRANKFKPIDIGALDPNYLIGPGDEIVLSLWGDTELRSKMIVSREGTIFINKYGQLNIAGLTLKELEKKLVHNLSKIYSGLNPSSRQPSTYLDVTLGKLQSIQVFVLGQVNTPGSHFVSSYSTVLSALYKAGGPKISGTLRDIRVLRDGKEITKLDLYDFINTGKKPNDIRLKNNDVIYVQPRHLSVRLQGEVIEEKIFELLEGETLSDLIKFSGGIQTTMEPRGVKIKRILPFSQRTQNKLFEVLTPALFKDIETLEVNDVDLEDKDIVHIVGIRNTDEVVLHESGDLPFVDIRGHVFQPGRFYLENGMRVKDLLLLAGGFQDSIFWNMAYKVRADLFRYDANQTDRIIIPLPIGEILQKNSDKNIVLQNRDSLVIYNSFIAYTKKNVAILGAVENPGKYKLESNMNVHDLILKAGGFTKEAYMYKIDVYRVEQEDEDKLISVFEVSITPDMLMNMVSKDQFVLQDWDLIVVRNDPDFERHQLVKIQGEVKFPGVYSLLYKEESMKQLIERAGGLTKEAFLEGTVFNRNDSARVVGDFKKIISSDKHEVILRGGDAIYIPRRPGTVMVTGNVRKEGLVQYSRAWRLNDYIEAAGSYGIDADKRKVVVYYPGGNAKRKRTLRNNPKVAEGSKIYIPTKKEREPVNMTQLLTSWASIAASLATVFYIVTK